MFAQLGKRDCQDLAVEPTTDAQRGAVGGNLETRLTGLLATGRIDGQLIAMTTVPFDEAIQTL
jgi:hypothetical protein